MKREMENHGENLFLLQMTKQKTIKNAVDFVKKIKSKQRSIWPHLGIVSYDYYKMSALLTLQDDTLEITRIFIDHESRHQKVLVHFIDFLKKIALLVKIDQIKMGCVTSQRMNDIMLKNKAWKRCEDDPTSFMMNVECF